MKKIILLIAGLIFYHYYYAEVVLKKEMLSISNDSTLNKARNCISIMKNYKTNDCVWYQVYFMDDTSNSKMKKCTELSNELNDLQKGQPFYKKINEREFIDHVLKMENNNGK